MLQKVKGKIEICEATNPRFYSSSSTARWRLPTGHGFARTANVFATASSLRGLHLLDGRVHLSASMASAGLVAFRGVIIPLPSTLCPLQDAFRPSQLRQAKRKIAVP
jgi:hypothetical protein